MIHEILELLKSLHSTEGLVTLISQGGLIVLIAIVFAETGLLVGFFLPGDSLLITAGILSSPHAIGGGIFSPEILIITLSIAAILGDQLNFYLGSKTGHLVLQRPDGRIVKKKYLVEAKDFYSKYGAGAIVLARFIPILRTFVPFVAGLGQMNYRRFFLFNICGGLLWVISMVLIGYWLGHTSWAGKLHQVILIVVIVSVLPIVIGVIKRTLFKKS